jgi:pyruvate/2-oxoglutarate/acetoin dehydrogenase E1 component
MARRTMIEAIRDAIGVMMERDDRVVVFGQDAVAATASALAPISAAIPLC